MNEIITHDTIISLPYLRPEQEHHHHRSVDRIFLGSSVAPERRVTVVTPDVDFKDLVCDTGQQLLVVLTPQQTEVREEGCALFEYT